jgi:hypothetical protein
MYIIVFFNMLLLLLVAMLRDKKLRAIFLNTLTLVYFRSGKIVEKAKLKSDGIMKYFDKSKLSKQAPPTSKQAIPPTTAKSNGKAAVDEITQKASGLNISAGQSQVKGQARATSPSSVSAIPDHVISEGTNGDAGSVRRSPRLAKRARPLNDDVSSNGSYLKVTIFCGYLV